MSRHDFPPEEFLERRRKAAAAVAAAGLDWLLIVHPVAIHWLTGSDAKGYQAFQCLLLPASGAPLIFVTRESERAEVEADALFDELRLWGGAQGDDPFQVLQDLAIRHGLLRARIGLEVPAFYLHPRHLQKLEALFGAALVGEANRVLDEVRLVKSWREIAFLRQAGCLADNSIAAFKSALAVGASELELADAIYGTLLTKGGGLPASPLNLVSGERAAFSHGGPTERRLARGDAGNVEYGAAYRRHTVTIGRTFSLGEPSARLRELYLIVREAYEGCLSVIAPGVPASVPHEAARRVIREAGLERYRVHTTGYCVAPGFPPAAGEAFHLESGNDRPLRTGMVLSVCPPLFIAEERLGARIADTVLVTERGAERLSQTSPDLICIGRGEKAQD
jgi:Xaa-Pro dipeptidase